MFSVKPLHENDHLVDGCVHLLNDEWPRSQAARLYSLSKSCSSLPYSLVLIENEDTVVGYCRLAKVISEPNSVLVESVVVDKKRRGQGLGRKVMEMAERHAARAGYKKMYLSTKDQQGFYQHLGYSFCQPVNTLGAQMLETCDCATDSNTPLPLPSGSANCCSSQCPPPPSTYRPNSGASNSQLPSAKDTSDPCCKQNSCESSSCARREDDCSPKSAGSCGIVPSSPLPVGPLPPPPPPPPPPPLSATKPTLRVDWMMKSIANLV